LFFCQFDDQAELGFLHRRRDGIAGLDAGKAALRASPRATRWRSSSNDGGRNRLPT